MSPLTLSPTLNSMALKAAFETHRRVHIPGILNAESAEAVTTAMEAYDGWRVSVHAGGERFEIPLTDGRASEPGKQSWIDQAAINGTDASMQYIFDTRRLTVEGLQDDVHDAVSAVPAFVNSPAFINFMRGVTGDDRIDFADAQATRYRPGHVLTGHNDDAEGKNRLYAYVLNLTRDWCVDWGGALVFPGSDGQIVQGFVPRFNALNLFAVPMDHAVTQVASFAQAHRLSITGWLRTDTPI